MGIPIEVLVDVLLFFDRRYLQKTICFVSRFMRQLIRRHFSRVPYLIIDEVEVSMTDDISVAVLFHEGRPNQFVGWLGRDRFRSDVYGGLPKYIIAQRIILNENEALEQRWPEDWKHIVNTIYELCAHARAANLAGHCSVEIRLPHSSMITKCLVSKQLVSNLSIDYSSFSRGEIFNQPAVKFCRNFITDERALFNNTENVIVLSLLMKTVSARISDWLHADNRTTDSARRMELSLSGQSWDFMRVIETSLIQRFNKGHTTFYYKLTAETGKNDEAETYVRTYHRTSTDRLKIALEMNNHTKPYIIHRIYRNMSMPYELNDHE